MTTMPGMTNFDLDVAWYYDSFPSLLHDAAEQIQRHSDAYAWLHKHFVVCVELLRKAQVYLRQRLVDQAACGDAALELLDRMGDWPRLWANWIDSEHLLQFAIQLAEMRGAYGYQAEFMNRLCGLYIDSARKPLAEPLIDRGLTVCRTQRIGLQLVKLSGTRIDLLIDSRNLDAAANLLDALEADPLVRRLAGQDRNEAQGQLLMLRAWLQRQRGLLASAQNNMTQAIVLLRQVNKVRMTAHAYRLLGLIYDSGHNPPEAITAFKQARHWSKALDDNFLDSWVVGNMGLIYWGSGHLSQAEKAFAISSHWAHTHHAFRQEVYETGNRALVALSQGRLTGADRLMREHKRQAEQYGLDDEIWRATGNLGVTCYHRGLYDEALTLLASENHHNKLNNASIWGRISTYTNLARLYAALGDMQAGYAWAQLAMADSDAHSDNVRLKLVCLRALADVYSQDARRIGQIDDIPVASPSRDKAIACLKDAVRLSKWRTLDRAGCYLSLAGLTEHAAKRQLFWDRGRALLERCGALSWLHYPVDSRPVAPTNPPRIVIFF